VGNLFSSLFAAELKKRREPRVTVVTLKLFSPVFFFWLEKAGWTESMEREWREDGRVSK
jgi:hypothetical protein